MTVLRSSTRATIHSPSSIAYWLQCCDARVGPRFITHSQDGIMPKTPRGQHARQPPVVCVSLRPPVRPRMVPLHCTFVPVLHCAKPVSRYTLPPFMGRSRPTCRCMLPHTTLSCCTYDRQRQMPTKSSRFVAAMQTKQQHRHLSKLLQVLTTWGGCLSGTASSILDPDLTAA